MLAGISIPAFLKLFSFIRQAAGVSIVDLALVFLKAGSLTYGSGFVIVGVLQKDVVENFHWLTNKEFIDGIIFGQITPGPVVITSTFIGYLTAGFTGSVITTLCIFLPTFIYVAVISKGIKHIKENPFVLSFLKGANAAAIGAILAVSYILSKDSVIDIPTLVIMILSLIALFSFRIKVYYLIPAAALAGILIHILYKF